MTENQIHLFHVDINRFKKSILKKYNTTIHVVSTTESEKLTFNIIERCTLEVMKIHNPEFVKYWRSKSASRIPEFILYYNIFT